MTVSTDAKDDSTLDRFLPPVADWFRSALGPPTPPQRMGWPAIADGENTLIVAPTGSGKTLAAFLAALDHLWRNPRERPGVRILYISPLKALNEDIRRNLRVPLDGILERSEAMGIPLPPLTVALRSGDTPSSERTRMVRKPPDILITTPESLHLMLTCGAREILKGISHVIVDEIHAVCGNKRGVFLAILLERLEAINRSSFTRIGLSATQRPLDEVARYLGGQRLVIGPDQERRFEARPVRVIDAGRPKTMDLQVLWPGCDQGQFIGPPGTTWPAIEDLILGLASDHRSTIIFTNGRRTVEKLTVRLNEQSSTGTALGEDLDSEVLKGSTFRAHHGSLSLEERRSTEQSLKQGELKGVVATASLELGIDMGDVDLVCQVESPGNVARALQRVGRAGHVVGGISKGRLIAKTPADLLETAALARSMVKGEIESLRVPRACLDVLAQQVVACVATERWEVPALFDLIRGAYPFRNLPPEVFEGVLCLVSGRFPTGSLRDLRARVAWDRIHNRLAALPGTARLALVGGGTIPDTGQYPVFLGEEGPRLGELDEEFVLERRVGEAFALGNNTWRIDAIQPDRVVVARAEGQQAVMPFWRGESTPRSAELGAAVGLLCREISVRLDDPELPGWIEEECRLEPKAARNLARYVARQRRIAGAIPDDRTVLVETFRDPAGELGLAVLTPLGGRLHQGLKIALLGRIRERFGIQASCLHGDDGLLIRLPQVDDPPLDLFLGLTADEAERLIREELPDTALFGLRFRQSAGRALLMPRPDPSKRTPLWLQRLRAKDLLQVVRKFPDFPIVVETFRECLDEDLDLPRLREFLEGIEAGTIRVVTRNGEAASPFASELVFRFTAAYLYEWDEPRRGDAPRVEAAVDRDLLAPLLQGLSAERGLDPQAVGRVESRLRQLGQPPRSAEEMAEALRALGDLTTAELTGPMEELAAVLESEGRARLITLAGTTDPLRWISVEEVELYQKAFDNPEEPNEQALETIVRRHLRTHALVGLTELARRYPIAPEIAAELLERWVESGGVIRLHPADAGQEPRWSDRENLTEIRRLTVAIRRRESVAVTPETFCDFLIRRQYLHPATQVEGEWAVETVLEQLRGFATTAAAWEEDLLPGRVRQYRSAMLDDFVGIGSWTWRAAANSREDPLVALVPREFAGDWPVYPEDEEQTEDERLVLELLGIRGASFAADLARGAGVEPSRVRRALNGLMRKGLATNDRFEPLRPGGFDPLAALALAASNRSGRASRSRQRRTNPGRMEGRWSAFEPPLADEEGKRLAWTHALLDRYGVLTRELLALEPWAPPWSVLAPWLARAELRGEIRRGFFVEGLSGVQYATDESAEELTRLAAGPLSSTEDVMLAAADPANLYGAGAPLDIPLLEGGMARLIRSPGNYLVVRGGRPVLIIEANGKRLTSLPSASRSEVDSAIIHLTKIATSGRKVLRVESFNGGPSLGSPVEARLSQMGFVRDYPGMTYYAAWAQPSS